VADVFVRVGEVMIASLISLLLTGLGIAFVVRKISASSSKGQSSSPLRSFFQFGVLFALLIIVANGVAGLLGRLINPSSLVLADDSSLARNLSFVVVGLPLLIGIGLWTRKGFRADPHLAKEPLTAFFVLLATMTSLLMALTSTTSALHNIVSDQRLNGQSLANAIVWILVWAGLWRLHTAIIPAENSHLHHIAGSLVGYIASVIGLISVIASVIAQLAGLNDASLISSGTTNIQNALISFAVGALVWIHYWVRTASKETQDTLWLTYVLIVGVGSGLVMAVVAASTSLYTTAVWFIGDPNSAVARTHFAGTPGAFGTVAVGLLAWWYHKSLLPKSAKRTEVNRVYEYIISGISLIASAVGLSMILIAALEALFSNDVIVGGSALNSFLAAGTLVIVGAPIWVLYWRGIQHQVRLSPEVELASPTRRIYLFLLFGIGGVAAIISLLIGVYQLFNDAFSSGIGTNTVRDMRAAIGVLVSTAIVAVYHWAIYRHEREIDVAFGTKAKSVLLVGPHDVEAVRRIAELSGARVTSKTRADLENINWPEEEVVAAITKSSSEQLIVTLDTQGVTVIPITGG
jgi:hypothetical protein